MDFLRLLLNGRKSYFTNEQVKRVYVPRYKELTTAKVAEYCTSRPEIVRYLPHIRLDGEPTVDREFLFSVLNTVEPDWFPAQLASIEKKRKEHALSKQENVVEVRPEILALLDAFDGLPTTQKSKGSARSLCFLKRNARSRKTPKNTGVQDQILAQLEAKNPQKRARIST